MAKVSSQDALEYAGTQAARYGVDPEFAKAILSAENMDAQGNMPDELDTATVSSAGASGLMQVRPATRKALQDQGFLKTATDEGLNEWQSQIHSGLAAIQEIMKRRKTNNPAIIAADYNAGPRGGKLVEEGNVQGLPAETQGYLKKVGMASAAAEAPENFSSEPTVGAGGIPTKNTVTRIESTPRSSTRTTTTSVSGMDNFVELVRKQGVIINNLIKNVTTSDQAEQEALAEAAKQAAAAGAAKAGAEGAKGAVEAASVLSRQRILNIFGLNTENVDNKVGAELARFETLDAERVPIQQQIAKRQGVGFFDDPIQWLINQTVLPGEIGRHNALAQMQNEAIEKVSTYQNLAKTQEIIDVAANADQIAKFHTQQGLADIASANERAATFRAQSASSTARTATVIAGLVGRQTDDELKLAAYNKTLTSEKKGSEEEAQLDADIKRIGVVIGAPNVSLETVKRMTKKDQSEWMDRVAKNKAGRNLAESIMFINEYGDPNVIAASGSAEFATVVRQITNEAIRAAKVQASNPLLQQQGAKKQSIQELMAEQLNGMETKFFGERQDMLLASPINPYKANHASTAMTWKGDPNNIVYKMSKEAITKNIKLNDAQLFAGIQNLVETEKLSPKDAAQQLADYYTAAIQRNNISRSPAILGMQPQDDYTILPKGATQRMNMLAPIQVEHFLTGRVVSRIRFEDLSPFRELMESGM